MCVLFSCHSLCVVIVVSYLIAITGQNLKKKNSKKFNKKYKEMMKQLYFQSLVISVCLCLFQFYQLGNHYVLFLVFGHFEPQEVDGGGLWLRKERKESLSCSPIYVQAGGSGLEYQLSLKAFSQ